MPPSQGAPLREDHDLPTEPSDLGPAFVVDVGLHEVLPCYSSRQMEHHSLRITRCNPREIKRAIAGVNEVARVGWLGPAENEPIEQGWHRATKRIKRETLPITDVDDYLLDCGGTIVGEGERDLCWRPHSRRARVHRFDPGWWGDAPTRIGDAFAAPR